jgi:hypothetical protein
VIRPDGFTHAPNESLPVEFSGAGHTKRPQRSPSAMLPFLLRRHPRAGRGVRNALPSLGSAAGHHGLRARLQAALPLQVYERDLGGVGPAAMVAIQAKQIVTAAPTDPIGTRPVRQGGSVGSRTTSVRAPEPPSLDGCAVAPYTARIRCLREARLTMPAESAAQRSDELAEAHEPTRQNDRALRRADLSCLMMTIWTTYAIRAPRCRDAPQFLTTRGEATDGAMTRNKLSPARAKPLAPPRLGVAVVCRLKFGYILDICTASYRLTDTPHRRGHHPERVDMHLQFPPSDGLSDPGGQFDATTDQLVKGISRS